MRIRPLLLPLTAAALAAVSSLAFALPAASTSHAFNGVAGPRSGDAGTFGPAASTSVAPGGNFDLSVWELQEPVGSPGSPTTIPSSRLQGANGFQDTYFYTDPRDGAMTFWAPEKGVTTPNSNYARSELREMNRDGSPANWSLAGSHRLNATLRVVSVTSNVCVGQIHLGTGGSSTKPLVELYYRANGDIVLGTEDSPSGGQTPHPVGHVAVGKTWSYTIAVSGGHTVDLTVNGTTTHYAIPSSFDSYRQYFKAGSYNQSSSSSTTKGARVAFYGLEVAHS
ncbi:polysaccharide lyase family 7 protein [Streptomyces sp. NPDC048491]|uniref:polysaccharide lyase family 7 protein n=1 Tax=Streptomyces sp. NPDC048491 TaxID=3157207 RepID=UPI003431C0F9